MKSFAILSDSGQMLYMWCDEKFKEHLKHLHKVDDDKIFSVIEHYFSLMTISYLAMNELKEPYSSIDCEKDKLVVCFHKYDHFVYVGLDSNTSCKDQVFRAIGFLRSTIAFLLGYSGQHQLKSVETKIKHQICYCLNTLLESYIRLIHTESSFFVEGIEKLQVNENIEGTCEALIKSCIQKINAKIKKQLQCILLFAGTKLLHHHQFSNASYLTTQTILMILAMMQSDFNLALLDDENFSFNLQTKSNTSLIQNPDHDTLYLTDYDYLFDNPSIVPSTPSTYSTYDESKNEDDFTPSPSPLQNDLSVFFSGNNDQSNSQQSYSVPVFLLNKKKLCMPCTLCCIPVLPSIRMAILFKNPNARICDEIRKIILFVKRLRGMLEQNGLHKFLETSSDFSACLDRHVGLLFKRSKQAGSAVRELTGKIRDLWLSEGKKYMKLTKQSVSNEQVNALKKCLTLMDRFVFDLFKVLYPTCIDHAHKLSPQINFHHIKDLVKEKLECYKDYLQVRNQLNITINTYLEKYPGLVHFAFVKRASKTNSIAYDVLLTPSLSSATCSNNIGKMFFSTLQKEFRDFKNLASLHHLNKEAVFGKKSNGFSFFSGITFGPLSYETMTKADIEKCWKEKFSGIACFSPGIFCSTFYERITAHFMHNFEIKADSEVYLNELVTVHFDGVPWDVIKKQRQELLNYLLEFN